MNVLLVEDDLWLGDCYSMWLVAAGVKVMWAKDAQEALDVLEGQDCDVILLDLLLPRANGVQLLNVLASHADFMNIPVVICSSLPPKDLVDWSAYSVIQVLDKATLTPKALVEAMHAVPSH